MELVHELRGESAVRTAWHISLVGEFYRKLTPVECEIAIAVFPHWRNAPVVIGGIHIQCQTELEEVGSDHSHLGLLASPRKGWEDQGGQDGEDRHDHEQLDETKCAVHRS